MRLALTAALFIAVAAPAYAQTSAKNASEASRQTSQAAGAIAESGVKATSGVVAIPMGGIAIASGAVGHSANASGYTDIGAGFEAGSASATKAAKAFVDFSGAPLTVSDELVIGRRTAPAPQAAPAIPYAAEQ